MKSIFKKVAEFLGNGRYIKLDGSSYHSKGPIRYLQRPEMKAGLAMSVAVVASEMILNGTYDIFHEKVFKAAFISLAVDMPIGLAISSWFHSGDKHTPSYNKAIDTKGTDLSRSQMTAMDAINLQVKIWKAPIATSLFLLIGVAARPESQTLPIDAYTVILMVHAATHGLRAKKLLDGNYTFVNKPPAKEVKSKETKTVSGGVTGPNL